MTRVRLEQPPVAAKWILENVRFENWNDALAGDLLESYRSQRRSNLWYWRQVLAVVADGFLRELRNHWVLASTAIFLGLEISYAAHLLGHAFIVRFRPFLEPLHPIVNNYSAWALVSLFCGLTSGWIIGILYRKHRIAMVLIFAVALVIWESIARFYISPFDLGKRWTFAILCYPSALCGIWLSQRLLTINRRASQT